MKKIQLLLNLESPPPSSGDENTRPLSLEEKVEDALDMIESGHESCNEWSFVISLWKKLQHRKKHGNLSRRAEALLHMMAPTINRHGSAHGIPLDLDLITEN